MPELDLSKYATIGRFKSYYHGSTLVLTSFKTGQKAAKELEIRKYAGEEIVLQAPDSGFGMVENKFMCGFLRPLAKEISLEVIKRTVSSKDIKLNDAVSDFVHKERTRLAEKEAQKKHEESKGQWSEPINFFIPEIGTEVRLKEDWTFRLFVEPRNRDLIQSLGADYQIARWNAPLNGLDAILKAGTILKIDRIYIRKGVSEYSSITFNIQKGKNSVAAHKKIEHVFTKKGARFWAKLSDVNKMVVEIDKATLADN